MKSVTRLVFLFLVVLALVSCGGKSAPTQPNMNPTPGMGNAPPTPTPASAATHTVSVGLGGNQFVDGQSGSSVTTIHAGQTVMWNWVSGSHSSTSGNCCSPDGRWDSGVRSSGSFSQMFPATGSFPYFCMVHGSMMTGMVVVNP
jgi:plastocyanin